MLRQKACCQSKHTFVHRLQLSHQNCEMSLLLLLCPPAATANFWLEAVVKLLINCSSSQFVATEGFSKMICFVQSFPLSFLSLGWNYLSEDTVLTKTATQPRPLLGCGLKSVLPTLEKRPLPPMLHFTQKKTLRWRTFGSLLFKECMQIWRPNSSPCAALLHSHCWNSVHCHPA